MDVLSDVLAICRCERAVTARFALSAPWALHSAGVSGALIRMARGAPYWLQVGAEAPVRVEPGDLVMLAPQTAHTVYSEPGLPAVPFADLLQRHMVGPHGDHPLVFSHGGDGAATELFTAHVWFSAYCRTTVLQILPPLLHVRAQDLPLVDSLAWAMERLVQESLAQAPGWRLSAARMSDLLLVQLLRSYLGGQLAATSAEPAPSWLRGLTDPGVARVIGSLHRAPAQAWTLPMLARQAHLSRSAFAARFKALVGKAPMAYLADLRMALAAEQLESGGRSLAAIADTVGYTSDKVFARAFRRWAGQAPSVYARQAARGPAGSAASAEGVGPEDRGAEA